MNNHFELIRNWAHERNLIDGSDSFHHMTKLAEEMGELAHGIAKDRPDEVMDGIGDMVVVLTIMAAQNGMRIEDCISMAWDEIKDRRGRMVDGIFIKEGDLPWSKEEMQDMANQQASATVFNTIQRELPP